MQNQVYLSPGVLLLAFIALIIGSHLLKHTLRYVFKTLPLQLWQKATAPSPLEVPPVSNAYGDARFATIEECRDLRGGMHLGYFEGQRLGYSGEQHMITVAPGRTGKGTTAIIPTLLEYDASIIVIDPKGEAAPITARARAAMGQEVYFLNPFGLHDLPDNGFNPLAALNPESPDFVAAVAALAEGLIFHDGGSSHWTDSARSLVKCLIMWECIMEENPTLPNALIPLGWGMDKFRERMKDINAHDYRPMAHLAGRFIDDEHKDAAGIVSTASTQTEIFLEPLVAASLSRHSFKWIDLKRRGVTVYLITSMNSLESHGRWLQLMISSALAAFYTSEKPEKPVLMILDEFAQLGRMANIERAAGAAAGHHVQIWPILQDLNQLEDLYGRRFESFLANMGVIQVFRPNEEKTSEYFSKRAGAATVQTKGASQGVNSGIGAGGGGSSGQSSGYSFGERAKPLFTAQDLMGLGLNEQIIFKAGLKFPIKAERVPYYQNQRLSGRFDPNPFQQGASQGPMINPIAGAVKPSKKMDEGLIAFVGFSLMMLLVGFYNGGVKGSLYGLLFAFGFFTFWLAVGLALSGVVLGALRVWDWLTGANRNSGRNQPGGGAHSGESRQSAE